MENLKSQYKDMIINLNGRLDSEMLDRLLEVDNTCQKPEQINIFLCSTGGDYEIMEAFLDVINNNSQYSIHGYGRLFSCAFDLFFLAECPKRLIGNVVGMYHMANVEAAMSELWTPVYTADAIKKVYMKGLHKQTMQLCEDLGFSKAEINRIKACHDVYFSPERMRKFLQINAT